MAMRCAARAFCFTALCLALGAAVASFAADPATAYPSRPLRIVVPFTPGGQPDIVARVMLPRLVESLGQPIIVDNRPGAGGTIGGRIVAGASPDGYTLMSVSAAHVVAPAVRAHVGYDTVKDFAGITMTANAAYYLVVPPSLEVRSVKELIALAKTKPGQLNFTSAGTGSSTHFAGEMFKFSAGIDIVHVPHKGIPEALTDTMAGRVQIFMAPFGAAAGLVRDGKLRALAVTTPQRTRMNPEIPTVAEAALPGFRYDSWAALLAPAKTSRAIIDKLNREVGRALKFPEVEQRLLAVGIEAAPGTPAELDRFIAEQLKQAIALAQKAGIKPE
jgi:tripartite-type tricarboxylate transporter receptor subunit TctC